MNADPNNPIAVAEYVTALEQRILNLEARLSDIDSPFKRIFLVRRTGTDADGQPSVKQWKERTVAGGQVVDFADGRACDVDRASRRRRGRKVPGSSSGP
jgi:hypothetical protein